MYVTSWALRNLGNPVQFARDLLSGTVGLELGAAAVAIGAGGRVRIGGPYCGREAECIVGGPAPGDAIALGHTVVFNEPPRDSLIGHEIQHVYDVENVGGVGFYGSYVSEYLFRLIIGQSHKDAYRNLYWEKRGYHVDNNYGRGARPKGWSF